MDEINDLRETARLKQRIRELEQLNQLKDAEFNNFMRAAPWGIFMARCTTKETIAGARVYYVNPVLTNMFNSLDLVSQPLLAAEYWMNASERSRFLEELTKSYQVSGLTAQLRNRDRTPFWGKIFARVIPSPEGIFIFGCVVDVTIEKEEMPVRH
jgi:hypothetical protein